MLLALQLNMLLEDAGAGTAPTITTAALAGGYVGAAYSRGVIATGDTPITWDITVGVLPGGLSLGAGTGVISGTPTTEETQTFTVRATNATGNDTQELSIVIGAEGAGDSNLLHFPRGMWPMGRGM